jgi:hypothetical protein
MPGAPAEVEVEIVEGTVDEVDDAVLLGDAVAEIEVAEALASGSLFALAKRAPATITRPIEAIAIIGSFLLFARDAGAIASSSDSSNHSGFSEVITDPFQLPKC